MSSIDVRVITDPDEVGRIIPVIESAWGSDSVGTLIKDTVSAMRYHGGVVIGAYEGDRMVGMHFSFPGYRKGKVYLYSHMTGVVSDLKYSGIGKMIKMKQREWAIENGYDLIAWTYDPIMSLNANFNIGKLGVIARSYLDNFYGQMNDSINRGFPTDRVVAEWWINKERPEVEGAYDILNPFSTEYDADLTYDSFERGERIGLKIPRDFVEMKKKDRELALKWRHFLRTALHDLFKQDYTIVGFDSNVNAYVLQQDFPFPGRGSPLIFR